MRNISTLVSVLVLSAGCVQGDASIPELTAMRDLGLNDPVLQGPGLVLNGPGLVLNGPGIVLNGPGIVLNGPGLVLNGPGLVLNGPGLVLNGPGLVLNGPGLVLNGPGLVLNGPGLVLNGSSFTASLTQNGVTYNLEGLDFIGAELPLRLTATVAGQPVVVDVVLRIDDIDVSEQHDDVLLYKLTYRLKDSDQWMPYCGDNDVRAVPMENYWDDATGDRIDDANVVTFACTNAVLAKCALWGYRPWATTTTCTGKGKKKQCTEVSLTDHHQACTRMARADFCGDGESRTLDGTEVDIFDQLDPHIQSRFTDWPVEAEWTPEGASCVSFVRHPELGLPSCFFDNKGKPIQKCKKKADSDSLIVTAFSVDDDDGQCGD